MDIKRDRYQSHKFPGERDRSSDRNRSRSRDRYNKDDGSDRHSSRSRKNRSRSRSRSGNRRRRRSRSPSSEIDEWLKIKAKRQAEKDKLTESKLWDKPPDGITPVTTPQEAAIILQPLLVQATMLAANPQQNRQARRLYVGNIPAAANEAQIAQFFNTNLANTGKCSFIPPVSNVQIHAGKAFAFLEFVKIEDATLCMHLDGIVFDNQKVKVRRPKDYIPIPGISSEPDLKDVILPGVVSTNVKDTPYKVYLGNLPTHLTDAQVQTLVSAFGQLKSFHLVTEIGSSTSKGYCFFEYAEIATTLQAVQGLNGLPVGDKHLTCSLANADKMPSAISTALFGGTMANGVPSSISSSDLSSGNTTIAAAAPVPTRILRLGNMVTASELAVDEEYNDILTDVKEEMCTHGKVEKVVIPRPRSNISSDTITETPGVGFIFVEFSDVEGAIKAAVAMTGRQFGGKTVIASFFDEKRFALNDLL